MNIKKQKLGFTLAEMIFVLLIMSMLTFFLYNLFYRAEEISNKDKSIIYEKQINFYRILKEDISSSFITHDTDFFMDQIDKLTQDYNVLRDFVGSKNEFSFYVKRGDHYAYSVLNNEDELDALDSGIYKVVYRVGEGNLLREFDEDGSSALNKKVTSTESQLLVDNSNIEFSYYKEGQGLTDDITEIPDRIIVKIINQKDEVIAFKHVVKV